jgi:CBS domain containing-hemolysin-like protein
MSPWLRVGIAFLLVGANGLLVTAEFALVRSRISRLEVMRRRGSRRAAAALSLARDLPRTLATTQVAITLANLGIGWLGEPAMAEVLEPLLGPLGGTGYHRAISIVAGFIVITFVTVLLGELVPKGIGIQKAETAMLFAATPLRLLSLALLPIVSVTNGLATALLKLMGLSAAFGEESVHTEEELRGILGRFHDRGNITRVGRDILERVLGFSRLTARQIMVPRPDVVWLDARKSPAENLDLAGSSGYTRFPYCDGDLDHVLGILHVKDLATRSVPEGFESLLRPPVVVPETATADRLLRLFQKRRLHLAVVVDEYGGTSGILTLEDVLEEIVGDLQDEFDQERPEFAPAEDGAYRIAGSARFDEIARRLGVEPEAEAAEADTIGGFVQQRLGRLARAGDMVALGEYRLRVEEVEGARITTIVAERDPESPAAV